MTRRRLGHALGLAAALLVGSGSWTSVTAAHGRFPATGQLVFHPTDPDVFLVRATFGLLVTIDGGETWGWVCPSALSALLSEDPAIHITSDGAILAAIFDGLTRSVDGGCGWDFPSADLTDRVVIDQAPHPNDPETVFAVTSDGGRENSVYRTDDGGETWTATGPPIDAILFETIAIAPSAPDRMYLTGAIPASAEMDRQAFVYRSDDTGSSWTQIPYTDFMATDRNIFLMGVDPKDENHLLMLVTSADDDRVVRSRDGGQTWQVLQALPSVNAFAWSPDGSQAWFGGLKETGLWRSDDGGETFSKIGDLEIGCLAVRDSELWACGNNFIDFGVARSADQGENFETVLAFRDIQGILTCDANSDTIEVCSPLLPDLIYDLGLPLDAGVPPPDGSGLFGFDAGTNPPGDAGTGGGSSEGCGCTLTGRHPVRGGRLGWWAVLVGVAFRLRNRLLRAAG